MQDAPENSSSAQQANIRSQFEQLGALRLMAPAFVFVHESGMVSIEWFPDETSRVVSFSWDPTEGAEVAETVGNGHHVWVDAGEMRDALASIVPISQEELKRRSEVGQLRAERDRLRIECDALRKQCEEHKTLLDLAASDHVVRENLHELRSLLDADIPPSVFHERTGILIRGGRALAPVLMTGTPSLAHLVDTALRDSTLPDLDVQTGPRTAAEQLRAFSVVRIEPVCHEPDAGGWAFHPRCGPDPRNERRRLEGKRMKP